MVLDEDKSPRAVSILDDPKRFKKSVYDDEFVVRELHTVLGEADVYLGQNSDRYDLRHLNARARYYGLDPLCQKESIDTLKEARKVYSLPSFKLDYMGRFFLGAGKMDTGGMQLWRDIAQYDFPQLGVGADRELAEKAVRKMVRYNRRDVKLTADLYMKIRPDFKKHPNRQIYDDMDGCPTCGSDNHVKNGYSYKGGGKFSKFQCRDCKRVWNSSLVYQRVHTKLA